jgi:hypothetical protein
VETEKLNSTAILGSFRKSKSGNSYIAVTGTKIYTITPELFNQVKTGDVESVGFTKTSDIGSTYKDKDGVEKVSPFESWSVVLSTIEAPFRALQIESKMIALQNKNAIEKLGKVWIDEVAKDKPKLDALFAERFKNGNF